MTRKQYLNIALTQSYGWLIACAASPGPYMKPGHVLLIRLAIAIKEGKR